MKIKHWDEKSQSWIIDGASNASNLELSNPAFVDADGKSVSIDHGFTKVSNKLTKLEQNLAWIYLNGAKGGTGTGPGTGGESYSITVAEGSTVYTSTSSATLNVTITSGTLKKAFTLVAKNLETNTIIGTWKIYSLTRTPIQLNDLNKYSEIELSAYDSNANFTSPAYVKIIAGAISMSLQSIPNKTIYIGGVSSSNAVFTINNNISNSTATFKLECNNIEVASETNIKTSVITLSYDLRDIIFNGLFNPIIGSKYYFTAKSNTVLDSTIIESNIINFDITVADANNLIIITEGISETFTDETITSFNQGTQLGFTYYLSYAPTIHSTFNINYDLYLVKNGIDTILDSGNISNVTKGINNRFVYSTVNLNISEPDEYLKIIMSASSVNDPNDVSAQYTKSVYFTLKEAINIELYANNDQQTLLAYFSKISGFPNAATGKWNYKLPTVGSFTYNGSYKNSFPLGIDLSLKDVNGKTSGFITDSDEINDIPGIILKGGSYGYLELGEKMFPQKEISSGESFFQQQGFNISLTFKADESSNSDETILSLGKYSNNQLLSGIEVTLEQVYVKIGSADTLICKLPQNQLLTIDLDVSYLSGGWYFKIYLNGILSAVSRVLESDIDWQFATDLYLGCRYEGNPLNISNIVRNTGIKSRFSNITIYDLKIYTSSQTDFAIVQNYISATEQASLISGQIDPTLDSDLRSKNLFNSSGDCVIWDRNANNGIGGYLEGDDLYNQFLIGIENKVTPYPLVLIEETSPSSTLFEAYSTAIFSASEKETIMSAQFPVKITYTDSTGNTNIITPNGVNSENGVRVGLQGTSSLSYNAKNFEIYMGNQNEEGKQLLFTPKDDWLPENEFTLKADVMDSAHVNNVVIGKIINGTISEDISSPFTSTPPMELPTSEVPAYIRDKIKHTSEGFPCLVFIRFAPEIEGNQKQIKFAGMYNFNLGRHAYYNLGLKLLTHFEPEKEGPSLVTDFTEISDKWNIGSGEGVYSLEINQNSSAQGAFQQDDLSIIKFMGDIVYSSRDKDAGYTKAQSFYTQMSNMALDATAKYKMDAAGQTPTSLISSVPATEWVEGVSYNIDVYVYDGTLEYYKSLINNNTFPLPNETNEFWEKSGKLANYYPAKAVNEYYNFSSSDMYLNWQNGCAYFVIGMLFGMVDSMCKNLTLRNWGTNVWYPSFYDMDTAFALNNAGQDIVEYWAHLHRWYNIRQTDTNISTFTQEKNYVSVSEVKQYYASWWNRIWEILENLPILDPGNLGSRTTIESTYINLRENLFPDPEKFINDHYKSYTDTTGSIIFNYDYRIKYLKIAQTYNVNTKKYTDSTDFSQLKFLHGNRVMHVKDWFKKRVFFLDSIYGIAGNTVNLPITIKSPITSIWSANKATGSNLSTKFGITLSANSKMLYHYSHDSTFGSFWLDENPENYIVPIPTGETIVSMYANKYITKFDNFKSYPWTGLNNVDFPLLQELDLSGLTNVPATDFFNSGVYTESGIGLKNIKKLILKNVKLIGDTASAYTLDVSRCLKLEYLDISNSSITNVSLPDSAVLKTYDLSNTKITKLTLINQSFLEVLNLDGCNNLTEIEISNCGKLKTINVPQNVTTIKFKECESIESINIPYYSSNNSISPLITINVDSCPGLKTFNINGQNNTELKVELAGATNLEYINLSNTNINKNNLTFASSEIWNSLKSLNIARTNISSIKFSNESFDYLNLIMFPNLDNIIASNCNQLIKVVCTNNELNPIDLESYAFSECSLLQRVIGHYNIRGTNIFKGCSNLILNEEQLYISQGTNAFLQHTDTLQATNISFSPVINTLISTFENCINLSYNDFKLIMPKIGSNVTSLEATFKGCAKVDGDIWYDIFRNCTNITILKEAFSGTQLTGAFYSRTLDYSEGNLSTYGILDFLPNLVDSESAFENTNLSWIDNRIFAPFIKNGVTTYSSIVKVDKMFRNCPNLKSCENTRADIIVPGNLSSENFFLNLRNLLSVYPQEVFSGCSKINMTVNEDVDGNTLLFHLLETPASSVTLTNSLYSGINLIGTIKENVFGGVTRNLNDYYIPQINSIHYPFNTRTSNNQLLVNMSSMGKMFNGLNNTLLQAVGIFTGVTCLENDSIPADIFKGCTLLNSVEACFANTRINNNNLSYEFPAKYVDNSETKGMFDDCINLKITKNLFLNCNYLKIKLVGEGFKNCQLTDVSSMFENTSLYGNIPYRLFFMSQNNGDNTYSLKKTIENMTNVFNGCWCLGYDSDRIVDFNRILTIDKTLEWRDRIIKQEGTKVSFKLDTSDMKKNYNFETNDYTFDTWYLDGYGWEDNLIANDPSEQSELDNLKLTLFEPYLKYDLQQKNVIIEHNNLDRYIETSQNYIVPTDLFRYCSELNTLSNVFQNFSWEKKILVSDPITGDIKIQTARDLDDNIIYDGLTGRLPMRLFESLKNSKNFVNVFNECKFDAFVGLQSNTLVRGINYPPDLFKYNINLTNITGMFTKTKIPVGVDINSNLFENLSELRVVSNLWSDCKFDNREHALESEINLYHPQIDFQNLFINNTKLVNVSGLFAAYTLGNGLKIINSTLLNNSFNLNDISNMFYYNTLMKGSVPTFITASYPILNNVNSYLLGCIKGNINNADELELRLTPPTWL